MISHDMELERENGTGYVKAPGLVTGELPPDELVEPVTPRSALLNDAELLVTQDRNQTHGQPTENFQHIADLWNVLLADKLVDDGAIDRGDVARLMVATKLARMRAGAKKDHWMDIAGYAACGYECDTVDGNIDE